MESEKIVTFATLEKVGYHDLAEKFKELGIAGVWSAGKKKVDLINKALAELAKIKELEGIKKDSTPTVGDEDKSKLDEDKSKLDEEEALDIAKKAQDKKIKVAAKAKAKAEKEASEALINIPKIEDYVEKINRVDANLLNNIAGHRAALLKKKSQYVKQFKELFGVNWETYERTLIDE